MAEALGWIQGTAAVRYDTDWAATGPLIERFGIELLDDSPWAAMASGGCEHGPTPLIAVCHLILKLHEAGKLQRDA